MGVARLQCRENPQAYMNRLQTAAVVRSFLDPGATPHPEYTQYQEAQAKDWPVADFGVDRRAFMRANVSRHDVGDKLFANFQQFTVRSDEGANAGIR
jgi:hypothetical protein